MLPGRARDSPGAAQFKGVSALRSGTRTPVGCKISRGPRGASPDPQPAGREAVGPTITWRSGSPRCCQSSVGGDGAQGRPFPRLPRSTLTPGDPEPSWVSPPRWFAGIVRREKRGR